MSIILKSAKVINTESKYHGTKQDILISKGKILKIAKSIYSDGSKEINVEGMHVSMGWFDSSVSFGEPGLEERETINKGLEVASKSGFTDLLLNSGTKPVISDGSEFLYTAPTT